MSVYVFQIMVYRIYVISWMVWLTLFGRFTTALDLLPCTDNPSPADRQLARRIIRDHTPPGYNMVDLDSEVTSGRNPHRWVGIFTRNDGQYECGCAYLTAVKRDFMRFCPTGSEISTVRLRRLQNGNRIIVEFLVNCFCTNIRRKRSAFFNFGNTHCNNSGYTTEHALCYYHYE